MTKSTTFRSGESAGDPHPNPLPGRERGQAKSSTFRSGGSGGIKPLNAPRAVYVQTDSAGNPVAIQVPSAINSPRGRRDLHPALAPGVRGALGRAGSSAGHARERGQASALVSDGRWVKVVKVEDLWKVNDEWWRGPEEEIARLYYTLRLDSGQQLTVYLDLIANSWYRQSG